MLVATLRELLLVAATLKELLIIGTPPPWL
jgi:hypothetical protein